MISLFAQRSRKPLHNRDDSSMKPQSQNNGVKDEMQCTTLESESECCGVLLLSDVDPNFSCYHPSKLDKDDPIHALFHSSILEEAIFGASDDEMEDDYSLDDLFGRLGDEEEGKEKFSSAASPEATFFLQRCRAYSCSTDDDDPCSTDDDDSFCMGDLHVNNDEGHTDVDLDESSDSNRGSQDPTSE